MIEIQEEASLGVSNSLEESEERDVFQDCGLGTFKISGCSHKEGNKIKLRTYRLRREEQEIVRQPTSTRSC